MIRTGAPGQEAARIVREDGVAALPDGVISVDVLAACASEAQALLASAVARLDELALPGWRETDFQYHEVASRGARRLDVRATDPAKCPHIVSLCSACEPIVATVSALLDDEDDARGHGERYLAYTGVVWSFPGSPAQAPHRDGGHLFGAHVAPLPPHALTVFMPLCDVPPELGPTQFYVGTHALRDEGGTLSLDAAPVAARMRAGGVLVMDYRTVHFGGANTTQGERPVLYAVYARTWFADAVNFRSARESLFAEDAADAFEHAIPCACAAPRCRLLATLIAQEEAREAGAMPDS